MNKKKKFDCVEMKHKIQKEIYEETKNMTPKEKEEYSKKLIENSSLADYWKKLKEQEESKQKKAG